MKLIISTLAFVLATCLPGAAEAGKVHVAVASNFLPAMTEITAAFEKTTTHELIFSSGSSGKLFAQINHGAPFDVFLSADQTKPQALERIGLAEPDSRFTYAKGALLLWSADAEHLKGRGGSDILRSDAFKKLAMANPRVAPYGAAAVQVLEHLGVKESSQSRWVQGENIAQTYQFVASGNAELGFIALSQAISQLTLQAVGEGETVTEGSSWQVPENLYDPVRQDAVLLKKGSDNPAAREFLEYLRSDEAVAIIHRFGYSTEN